MKNYQISSLINCGCDKLNYRGLEPKAALKVVRFGSALRSSAKAVETERNEIIRQVFGDKLKAAQKTAMWLQQLKRNPNKEKPEGLMPVEEYQELDRELNSLLAELEMADVEFKPALLSFEEFYKLVELNENVLDSRVSAELEGILWQEGNSEKGK